MIRFRCPKCDSQMEVDDAFAGRPARCPTCGVEMRVPRAEEAVPVGPMVEKPRPGVTTVKIGGETVEVMPPVDTMALVSVVLAVLSVALMVVVALFIPLAFPWTTGMGLGALVAFLAAMTGLPSYHNVRRSRGRKRGKTLALIAMAAGGLLCISMGAGALAGVYRILSQPTCEDRLQVIYTALRAHADDHDGRLMPTSLERLVEEGYLEAKEWLRCPAQQVVPGTVTYTAYLSPTLPINVRDPIFPPDLMIVSDGLPLDAHKDGMVRVLLLNGDVQLVPVREWESWKRRQATLRQEVAEKAAEREAERKKTPEGGGP